MPFNGFETKDEVIEYATKWIDKRDLYKHVMAELPIDFFYDEETVKMMERRQLSEKLKMPAFNGSVNDVPCVYADFAMMYEMEYNYFLETRK